MDQDFWQERTKLLIKEEKLKVLKDAHVFIAGLGGVGAYAAELLCRAGIGALTIADSDTVSKTNRNRQLIALSSTEGKQKVLLMKERLLDINPALQITTVKDYLRDGLTDEILETPFDYVVDAIDTLSPKIFLIYRAVTNKLPLVSSMGAGGKLDPSKVMVAEFSDTKCCNLAKILRKRLRRLGVSGGFKAVYSNEPVDQDSMLAIHDEPNKKTTVGTISYMPALFGCYCASVVVRDMIGSDASLIID
jgi:tRNA threonylcarbamoyladenosine dehydratase